MAAVGLRARPSTPALVVPGATRAPASARRDGRPGDDAGEAARPSRAAYRRCAGVRRAPADGRRPRRVVTNRLGPASARWRRWPVAGAERRHDPAAAAPAGPRRAVERRRSSPRLPAGATAPARDALRRAAGRALRPHVLGGAVAPGGGRRDPPALGRPRRAIARARGRDVDEVRPRGQGGRARPARRLASRCVAAWCRRALTPTPSRSEVGEPAVPGPADPGRRVLYLGRQGEGGGDDEGGGDRRDALAPAGEARARRWSCRSPRPGRRPRRRARAAPRRAGGRPWAGCRRPARRRCRSRSPPPAPAAPPPRAAPHPEAPAQLGAPGAEVGAEVAEPGRGEQRVAAACAATSPSECPSSPRSPGQSQAGDPQRAVGPVGASACTSTPTPTRGASRRGHAWPTERARALAARRSSASASARGRPGS